MVKAIDRTDAEPHGSQPHYSSYQERGERKLDWRKRMSDNIAYALLVYTALLWGVGLYGGYRWAYQGIDWAGWPLRASVDTFWITSTAALALVSARSLMLTSASSPGSPRVPWIWPRRCHCGSPAASC